jgi:hypothetical protein
VPRRARAGQHAFDAAVHRLATGRLAARGAFVMNITRKEFCAALTGGSVLLLLQSCGGGGSYGGGGGMTLVCGASGGAIAGNHGHVLTILRADLDSLTDKTYSITGTADHTHSVTFTPTQLQQLKAGADVAATTTTGGSIVNPAHSHTLMASVMAGCP